MRLLALSIAVSSALLASKASALGLGELNVKSALNEPLQAEIQLLQVRDLKASEIRPRLADDDAFSLAGLSRSGVLSSVDFDVELNAQGGAKVVISSDTPVREPFISFLMEVNWPNGRLVREYTLLLDPPLFVESANAPTPVVAPTTSSTSLDPVETVKAEPEKVLTANPSQTVQETLRNEASLTNQIYVGVNDTLYKLAQTNLPSETVSVNQMMLAMQRLNPDSFPTNNINVLKAGTVLTLPSKMQANELTAKQAALEVRKQYDEWKSGRPSPTAAAVEKDEVSEEVKPEPELNSNQPSETDNSSEAKLKLVSVDEPKDQALSTNSSEKDNSQPISEAVDAAEALPVSNPSGSDVVPENEDAAPEVEPPVLESVEVTPREQALQALNRDLENQLLVTQESVEKVERDNADLSAKLDSIAEQLQTMQRLIELKDQQVAQLQQQLDQQMQLAQQRNEDPVAAAVDYVRMNPEIVGGSAVAFLLLLLLLVRSSRKPAPHPEPKSIQEKVEEVAPEPVSVGASPTMAVVEPSPVETAFEASSIDPVADEKLETDSDSIARAEAEIQSMIDEVLRARASEQAAQAEMEASSSEPTEESKATEIDLESSNAIDQVSIEPEVEIVSDNSPETETDDFLSRANAAMSPAEADDQDAEVNDQEAAVNDRFEEQPDSDDLEEFFDSELEASLADSDSVESIVEPVEEESADLKDLDFVIEPFDSDSVDEPQESQIPAVEMPVTDSSVEPQQTDSIEKDLQALEALMDNVDGSSNTYDSEAEQEVESTQSLEENWEFVVEESDSGSLDSEIEKIFDEVDGDLEVIEEINDTAESEDFDTHFYSGADENETRLDLARAYIEMDDYEAARDILVSMKDKGSSAQQQEVANLLDQLDKA